MNWTKLLKITPAFAAALWLTQCTVDLRTGTLREGAPSAAQISRGKQLMNTAMEKHGGRAAWEKIKSFRVRMNDTWTGFMGRMANPWPEAAVDVEMSWLRGTYTAKVKFEKGDLKNTTWTLRNLKTYQVDARGKTTAKKNADQSFIIRALLYFAELPFRLPGEAPRIAHMGSKKFAGRNYELVMATWGKDFVPSSKHDQYVLWIGAKSGRVEKAFYTVREIAGFVTGCMHYDDFKEANGVLFSYTQTVTSECEAKDYRTNFLHQVKVSSVKINEQFTP